MSTSDRACLIRLVLRMGTELGAISQEQLERISNQRVETISSEELLLLANAAERAAEILKDEAKAAA